MANIKSLIERLGKRIQSEERGTVFVGVDVHKKSYHIAVWSSVTDGLVFDSVAPASPEALASLLEPFAKAIRRVTYEAGPTGYGLARYLIGKGFAVEVIAPSETPQKPGDSEKSDRLDAIELARLSSKNNLQPVYIPTPEEEADRQVTRWRETRRKEVSRTKVRIKMFLLEYGVAAPQGLKNWGKAAIQALWKISLPLPGISEAFTGLLRDLDYHLDQLKAAEAAVHKLSREKRHKERSDLLQKVGGVGEITAMTLLTELPRIEQRFTSKRSLGKMLGLAPKIRGTGQKIKQMGRIRCGNSHLRGILIEAAWAWVRRDDQAKNLYRRMLANTGNKKKAIVAVARKLGIILWRMLVTNEPYNPKLVTA